jgi:hypothetical protein
MRRGREVLRWRMPRALHRCVSVAGTVVSLAAAAAWLPACTGLEPAAIGAGATVAQSATTVLDRGKARMVERVGRTDALAAARRAGEALALRLEGEREYPMRTVLFFRDDHQAPLTVGVEARTATMSLVQVDVGLLGEITMATAFLRQFQESLASSSRGRDAR